MRTHKLIGPRSHLKKTQDFDTVLVYKFLVDEWEVITLATPRIRNALVITADLLLVAGGINMTGSPPLWPGDDLPISYTTTRLPLLATMEVFNVTSCTCDLSSSL